MRRWILGLLVIIMVLLMSVSIVAGYQIESRLADQLNELDERLESVRFVGMDINRGWFTSTARWSIEGLPEGSADATLRIAHGLAALLSGRWLDVTGQVLDADDSTRLDGQLSGGLGLSLRSELVLRLQSDSVSGKASMSLPWGFKQGQLDLNDLRLRLNNAVSVDGLVARLQFDRQLATDIELQLKAERIAWVGSQAHGVRQAALTILSSALNQRAELNLKASATSWQQGETRLDSVRYESTTREINLTALNTVLSALRELRRQGYPTEVVGQQLGSYIFLAIPELLRVQPSHQLTELSWTQPEGAISMQGQIGLTSEPQGAFISEPGRLLEVLQADGNLAVPESVFRGWLDRYYSARVPELTDVQRQTLIEQHLEQYQLLESGSEARARFQFQDSELIINAVPVIRSADLDRPAAPS